ncbi:DNA ligase D [Parafilimonas sp.]|uniref:DNA ligase D n=1 Tax=Parafilimonas sp. TaxID=1969739 RepID=UPI0039E46F10
MPANKKDKALHALLVKGTRQAFPKNLPPMLATLVDKPFDEAGWLYEVKWDGYRAIIYRQNSEAEMRSRNNKSFNEKFYAVYNALKQWKINAVLDGEIVVINDEGISNFGSLQNWRSEADGALILYLFDVLWIDGYNVMNLPLTERKQILNAIAPDAGIIRISESFDTGATEFFEAAKKLNLEGIIAKRANSIYLPGKHSSDWLKIKTNKRQEVIIGGFTNNEGSSKLFSALLVGVNENGKLKYTGKIGTGFSDKLQQEMMQQFSPLITNKIPFTHEPDVNKPSRFRPDPPKATVTWLKPKLVCEVAYTEITSDGVMRHPSFKGMRVDKSAKNIHPEKEAHTKDIVSANKNTAMKQKAAAKKSVKTNTPGTNDLKKKLLKGSTDKAYRTLLNPTEKAQTKTINGHSLTFNNLNKIYFPAGKNIKPVTKRDVINYYYQVAPYMLPFLKDRPQTMIRYPNGINGQSFYQKDVTGKVPDWIELFPYSTEEGGDRNYMICTNEAGLLLMASLGSLEIHPWSSRAQKPDNPDWCIIDLDPGDKTTFDQVIQAAQQIKQVLDAIGADAYCKTSGATGMHIYIPLGAKYDYEISKEFARVLVTIVQSRLPKFTSIERIVQNRKGNMYLDFLQNRPQATLAAPYSLRPKPGATVSMPLHWDEVKKGLTVQQFNIFNAVDRIKEQGEIFKGVTGKGINLKKVLKQINAVFGEQEMHESLLEMM